MNKNFRIWIYQLVIIGMFLIFTSSCKKGDDNNGSIQNGIVKDIDGNTYTTVTIGTQVWMVENLKTTKYRNGEPIPNITKDSEWSNLKTGAYCNYNNDPAIGNKYGKLYNWYAVNDHRNISPTGWHIPTDEDWSTLSIYISANLGTSGSLAKALATKADWASSINTVAIGNDLTKNNTSGFSALPGGDRISNYGTFHDVGTIGYWWSSTEENTYNAWIRKLNYNFATMGKSYNFSGYEKEYGFSVRCVKDF